MTRSAVLSVAASFAVFVLVWKAIVVIGGYPPFILPPPESVASRFVRGWADGVIAPHAWSTLVEIALGLLVKTVIGLVASYRLAQSALVERIVSPYIVALRDHGVTDAGQPYLVMERLYGSDLASVLARRRGSSRRSWCRSYVRSRGRSGRRTPRGSFTAT